MCEGDRSSLGLRAEPVRRAVVCVCGTLSSGLITCFFSIELGTQAKQNESVLAECPEESFSKYSPRKSSHVSCLILYQS